LGIELTKVTEKARGLTYGKKRLFIRKCADIVVELLASIWADDAINKLPSAREDARSVLLNCHFGLDYRFRELVDVDEGSAERRAIYGRIVGMIVEGWKASY
jgi:hypothetical protein